MGGRGSGRDMPGYPHVWGAVPEGWSSDLACNARQDADLRAVFGAFNKVFVIVSRRKTQLRGAATAQQWWSQDGHDSHSVGLLQVRGVGDKDGDVHVANPSVYNAIDNIVCAWSASSLRHGTSRGARHVDTPMQTRESLRAHSM